MATNSKNKEKFQKWLQLKLSSDYTVKKILYHIIFSLVIIFLLVSIFFILVLFLKIFRENITIKLIPWIYIVLYAISTIITFFIAKYLLKKIKKHKTFSMFFTNFYSEQSVKEILDHYEN